MIVYHGSLDIIAKPEIRESNRTLDYGSGFYTTTSSQQAEDWVRRRMKGSEVERGYVNIYEFTTVPLKWTNRSLKSLKYSLLQAVLRVNGLDFVTLRP